MKTFPLVKSIEMNDKKCRTHTFPAKHKTRFYDIFVKFFINSDSNQSQTLKLTPNLILTRTQNLILTLKKANEKCTDEYCSILFYSLQLKIF